jgi:peptidoglycan/LPS O-acetylase OafA/YrhL
MTWLDALRGLAVFCVVVGHSRVSRIILGSVPATRATWLLSWLCLPHVQLGVPLFTVISGYLLMGPGRREGALAFWRKRAWRILPALLVWQTVYALLMTGHPFRNPRGPMHLWFLWSLMALYAVTPLLRLLVARVPARLMLVFSLAGVAALGLTNLRSPATRETVLAALFLRSWMLLPFYLLGSSLHGLKPLRWTTILLLLLAGPVLRPPVCGLWHAVVAASLLVWLRDRETPAIRLMAAVGRRSYGIYLSHRAFELWLFWPLWGTAPLAWYVVPVEAVLVTAISYGVGWAYDVGRTRAADLCRERGRPPPGNEEPRR